MWTSSFWKGAVERMIRAAAAALLGVLTTDKTNTLGSVPWEAYATTMAVAAVTSLLISVVSAGSGAGPAGSASTVFDRPADPQNR